MSTIFMNSKNSKISYPYRLVLNLADKMDLRRGDKRVALSDLSTWNNLKTPYGKNKAKISGTTWDEELELPNGFY